MVVTVLAAQLRRSIIAANKTASESATSEPISTGLSQDRRTDEPRVFPEEMLSFRFDRNICKYEGATKSAATTKAADVPNSKQAKLGVRAQAM